MPPLVLVNREADRDLRTHVLPMPRVVVVNVAAMRRRRATPRGVRRRARVHVDHALSALAGSTAVAGAGAGVRVFLLAVVLQVAAAHVQVADGGEGDGHEQGGERQQDAEQAGQGALRGPGPQRKFPS